MINAQQNFDDMQFSLRDTERGKIERALALLADTPREPGHPLKTLEMPVKWIETPAAPLRNFGRARYHSICDGQRLAEYPDLPEIERGLSGVLRVSTEDLRLIRDDTSSAELTVTARTLGVINCYSNAIEVVTREGKGYLIALDEVERVDAMLQAYFRPRAIHANRN